MAIGVTCQACASSFRAKDEFAGRQGKCPRCGATLRVPASQAEQPSAGQTTASSVPAPSEIAPVALADDVAPPAVSPQVVIAAEPPLARYATRPAKRRPVPRWAWYGVAGLAAAGIVGLALPWYFHRGGQAADAATARSGGELASRPKTNPAPFHTPAAVEEVLKPADGAPLEDVVAYIKQGIVKIETSDVWNNRRGLGSGFLIDAGGLVATNYHVLADAVKADVLFNDGTRYGIEGYLAVAPERDLAIVKLNGTPPGARPLELRWQDSPRDAARVYAIGHPHNHEFTTTEGIVGRVLMTSQLPDDTRSWLDSVLLNAPDLEWIQHGARISQGNSGGPLINARGEVLGINSWVNQKIGFGYALHARYIRELSQRLLPSPAPLREHRRDLDREATADMERRAISADRVQALLAECAARQWEAKSDGDYARLEELAQAVTITRYLELHPAARQGIPRRERLALSQAANSVEQTLAAVEWDTARHIGPINGRIDEVARKGVAGVFLFGSVEQVFAGEGDDRGLLVSVTESDKKFLIGLERPIEALKQGTQLLVVGLLTPTVIQYGENPLKPQSARLIYSRVVQRVTK